MKPPDTWVILLIVSCSRQAFVATLGFVVLQEGARVLEAGIILFWVPG